MSSNGKKLSGKVAIVTGASKGIGAAIAKSLATEGASVVVNYASSKSGADAVVAAITESGGKAIAVKGNVAKAADAQAIVDAAIQNFGHLDILVNNAGVYAFQPNDNFTEELYDKTFDVNVRGLLLITQAATKYLGEGSTVINVGSLVTEIHPPTTAIYTATKGAVDAITRVLANELAPRKIRVNSINPGFVFTEGTKTAGIAGTEREVGFVALTPLGRAGQVDDIASVATFLASQDAKWLTGELVHAGGGAR